MKKFDLFLIAVAAVALLSLVGRILSGMWLIKFIVGIATLLVLLYWKLVPYKGQLSSQYMNWFVRIEKIIRPIWNMFNAVPNIQLGSNLSMESAPLIICSILIIILTIL